MAEYRQQLSQTHDYSQLAEALPEPDLSKLIAEASAEFHETHDPLTALQRFAGRRKTVKADVKTKPDG